MTARTYVLFHQGRLTAVYNQKSDLIISLRNILAVHKQDWNQLMRYDVHELEEHIPESDIYVSPRRLDIRTTLEVASV